MNRRSFAVMAGGCALATACYSLDITAVQSNAGAAYTREEVLAKPELMELVVGGVFVNLWGGIQNPPTMHYAMLGEECTSGASIIAHENRTTSTAGDQIYDLTKEPRTEYDNSLTSSNNFMSRDAWSNFYEANAAATEMPRLIKANNLKIIVGTGSNAQDNTLRVLTFAKWVSAIAHSYLGLIFDSASIINETVDLSKIPDVPFSPYPIVIDSAVTWLQQVIDLCAQALFIFPYNDDLWIYSTAISNDEMARIAHSYIARALVYSARTPTERNAVDWAKVKLHAQAGTHSNFGPTGAPNPLIGFDYKQAITSPPDNTSAVCNGFCEHAGEFRVDYRLIGPADTSGAYQTWLAAADGPNRNTLALPFIIRTPDKRIQAEGNITPTVKPVFFKQTTVVPPVANQPHTEPYNYSFYWSSSRALNNNSQFPRDGGGRNRRAANSSSGLVQPDLGLIQDVMMTGAEIDLLEAEADIHLGDLAGAVTLINKTRVANGELPPVTTTGVPQAPGCVPKRFDGSCGNLMDALIYEKRIETFGTGIAFYDLRGWGCLLEGTPTMLPPPGRQLDLSGRPIYSYGGHIGSVGTAPVPTNCPLMVNPNVRGHG